MNDDPTKEVGVTICPPGSAEGADDLSVWGKRRRVGRYGMVEKAKPARLDAADRWLSKHDKQWRKQRRRRR